MSDNLANALSEAGFVAPVIGNGSDHTAPETSGIVAPETKPARKPRVLAATSGSAKPETEKPVPAQGAQSDAAALIGHLRAKRAHRTRLADSIKDATPSARVSMLATLAERDTEIAALEKRVNRLPKALHTTAAARDTRAGIAASVTRYAAQLRQFRKGTPTHGKLSAKLAAAQAKLDALATA